MSQAHEPLCCVVAVKWRYHSQGSWKRGDLKSRSVTCICFSVNVQNRKRSMGWKACENLPGVGMRLYVKFGRWCKAIEVLSVMPGHTDRQTKSGQRSIAYFTPKLVWLTGKVFQMLNHCKIKMFYGIHVCIWYVYKIAFKFHFHWGLNLLCSWQCEWTWPFFRGQFILCSCQFGKTWPIC